MLLMICCISPCQLHTQGTYVAGEMQHVQITLQILSASQLRLLATTLEFPECLLCSLQFGGPISDSSDISLALTAC